MNLSRGQSVGLASALAEEYPQAVSGVEIAVCPPSVYLDAVGQARADSAVQLGAQNMYHQSNGAFTGELSAEMLNDVGCRYVILGHSERRAIYGESDEVINAKLKKAREANLKPIFCIGETLAEREAGKLEEVLGRQVTVGLDPLQIREIRALISELGKEHGIILSTHILPEVQQLADVVGIVNGIDVDVWNPATDPLIPATFTAKRPSRS